MMILNVARCTSTDYPECAGIRFHSPWWTLCGALKIPDHMHYTYCVPDGVLNPGQALYITKGLLENSKKP